MRMTLLSLLLIAALPAHAETIRVLQLKSHTGGSIYDDVVANAASFGPDAIQFSTYEGTVTLAELNDRNPDVLVISNPSGGNKFYTTAEKDAILAFLSQSDRGRGILGEGYVFNSIGDTRPKLHFMGPIFGFRDGIVYENISQDGLFEILPEYAHLDLFTGFTSAFQSRGFLRGNYPFGHPWLPEDLNEAVMVARNADQTGIISIYDPPNYRAVYVSVWMGYDGSVDDQRMLYNCFRSIYHRPPVEPSRSLRPIGNRALRFSAHEGDHVVVPRTAALEPTQDLTAEIWAKGVDPVDLWARMVGKTDEWGTGYAMAWGRGLSGHVRFGVGVNDEVVDVMPNADYLNAWHHFAGVYSVEQNRFELLVDGHSVATAPLVGPLSHAGDLFFGAFPPWEGKSFNGLLREARLWGVARTPSEIRSRMELRLSGDEPGLLGYWPMDEGAGQIVHDRTANGSHGRLGSTDGLDASDPEWTVEVGDRERHLAFDGADDCLIVPWDASIPTEVFSAAAWVRVEAFDGPAGLIARGEDGVTGRAPWGLRLGADGTFEVVIADDVGTSTYASSQAIADGRWHHVAVTRDDSGTLVLYVDGDHAVTYDGTALPASHGPEVIGIGCEIVRGGGALPGGRTTTSFLNGAMDDVALWNLALSPVDIARVAHESPSAAFGLVGYWALDECEEQTAFDRSPRNNHAILGVRDVAGDDDPRWVCPQPPVLAPAITAIRDVPHDQGGKVYVTWTRSSIDTPELHGISTYRVWQRAISPSAGRLTIDLHEYVPGFGVLYARERRTPGSVTSVDYWEPIAEIPAAFLDGYAFTASTHQDSTRDANPFTAMFVQALTPDPLVFFNSAVDSGYSVDNIRPRNPTGFTGRYEGATTHLQWNGSLDEDFHQYHLYRGDSPSFIPDEASRIAAGADTGYVDREASETACYKLAAEDDHGNTSDFALLTPSMILGARGLQGLALGFVSVRPNPTSGERLEVTFTLPQAEPARIEVIDVGGRRLVSREVGMLGKGVHTLDLAGGWSSAPGLYLLRILQAGEEQVARTIVID